MITDQGRGRQPTKQRLIEAGVRLFAEQGFRETTVGQIEEAVGLVPRRGALYRHFPSKEALLQAALEAHLGAINEAGAALAELPLTDMRTEAIAVGRWLFAELDAEAPMVRILEQDGDRLPELRDMFRQRVVDAGYLATAQLARRWLGDASNWIDVDAVAVVLLGSLVNFRRSTWTFGHTPLNMDPEAFLAAWADLCVTAAAALQDTTA